MLTLASETIPSTWFDNLVPSEITDRIIQDMEDGKHVDILAEVEDFFGSDYIIRFDGTIILTDRNCGWYSYINEQDFNELVNSL